MSSNYPAAPETIGEHLLKRRLDLRLRQQQVADRMGVKVATVRDWETGSNLVSLAIWPAVLEFLGYDPRPPGRTIGEKLRLRRKSLGLSAAALAREWSIGISAVLNYERNADDKLDHRAVAKIARFLGYNPLPEPVSPKEYVRHARYLLGLSRQDFAKRLRVSVERVARWEHGETPPSAHELDHIQAALAELTEPLRPVCAEHVGIACASANSDG